MCTFLYENKRDVTEKVGGIKDQLLIDRMVLQHCKKDIRIWHWDAWTRERPDMVPHSWIIECLEFLQIADNIKQFLRRSMTKWQIELLMYLNLFKNGNPSVSFGD